MIVNVQSGHEVSELLDSDESLDDNYIVKNEVAYNLSEFMRVENSRFDAVYTLCNTVAYGLILSANGERAIIRLIS